MNELLTILLTPDGKGLKVKAEALIKLAPELEQVVEEHLEKKLSEWIKKNKD